MLLASKMSTVITKTVEEEEEVLKGKPTLVRRVSNMLKDGNYSGPPMLFRHSSMQKIRHCCQNFNLFPYLLYSFENSKSHPLARKVNCCIGDLVRGLSERIFFLYQSLRRSVLGRIRGDIAVSETNSTCSDSIGGADPADDRLKLTTKFQRFEHRRKRKENPVLLTMAVYFAPLVLVFQLVGLCSLMIFGKYTPGFIFLIAALMFLGCIKLKILFHDATSHRGAGSEKKRKLKVQ